MKPEFPFAKSETPSAAHSHPRWSPATEEQFIEALGETANISAAIEATTFSPSLVYKRKGRDPEFAARWEEALNMAHDWVDTGLIELAIKAVAKGGALSEAKLSVKDVLAILSRRDKRLAGGRAVGPRTRRRDPKGARAAILEKVQAIKRARAEGEQPT